MRPAKDPSNRSTIAALCVAFGFACSVATAATTQKTSRCEAEDAATISGGLITSASSGFSGTGYVDYQNASGDFIEWTVDAVATGSAELVFRYALPSGDRPLQIKVNGVVVASSLSFPATGALTTWGNTAALPVTLNAGINTIRATATGSSGANVDYLQVKETQIPIPGPLMTVYAGQNQSGTSATVEATHLVYSGASIPGGLNDQISSFVLAQGYMAVVADQVDGLQPSKVYIAADGPLTVSALPANLENAISFIRVVPWKNTLKKGFCGGDDAYRSHFDHSWYYDWTKGLSRGQRATGPEYVTMCWDERYVQIADFLAMDQVSHLISFNEPDGVNQANMPDIAQAVTLHTELQKAGLRLGSPACEEQDAYGTNADGTKKWLPDFMDQAAALGVRVDHIDLHWYDWGSSPGTNTTPNPVDVANRLKAYLSNVYARYRKPIWITEFNANPARSRAIQDGFLQEILPYLDDVAYVERYAYYQWPAQEGKTMYFVEPADGSLTSTGQIYSDHQSPAVDVEQGLPAPWQSADVGTSNAGASLHNGNFTLSGSGVGITGTADGCHYVHQPVSGDVTITALVRGQIWRNNNTMAGVMIREGLGSGAKQASMVLSWSNGAKFLRRTSDAGTTTTTTQTGIPKYPYWVRLVRSGDTFTGYTSPDGITWTQVGSATIAMSANIQVGLAASSFSDGSFNDAIFKNVTVVQPPPPNSAPTWSGNPITGANATEDVAYSSTLAGAASDANNNPLTFAKVSGPAWLSVAANGALSGTPTNANVGANSFVVSVSDGIAAPVQATLNIAVSNVNDAPSWSANPIAGAAATEDVAYSGTLAGLASDIDAGATLTYAKVSGPAWLSVATNGALGGTPGNAHVGTNSFVVSVSDGVAAPVQTTLNIAVANVNDAPVWSANPISKPAATEDVAYSGTLAGLASDVDAGAVLSYAKVSGPAWLSVAANGALSGTPANANVGTNSFVVSVSDGIAAPVQATLNIAVSNVNDAPVWSANPIVGVSATEGVAYTGQTLSGLAADADVGDTITYSKVSGPAWLSVATNGALSGTPPAGSAGLNSFTVRVSDSSAASADATLQITVAGLPLPWTSTAIGTGMLASNATYSAGVFTQSGSGIIGSASDKFRFTYQTLSGDGQIIARISSLQDTGTSSRVGVMIRDTLAANSKAAFMGMTGSNAYRWTRRTTTGGSTSLTKGGTGTVPNTWVKLVRSGTTISAYKSADGVTWTSVGSITNTTFSATCYIGLAVGSGSDTTLNTSKFSNVSVTP